MTTHVRLQCSAVLAILVVVATAGNLWAGEWRETPYFTEDFAPDPGWDTFLDGSAQLGYPEENFIRVVNERMVADMGAVPGPTAVRRRRRRSWLRSKTFRLPASCEWKC